MSENAPYVRIRKSPDGATEMSIQEVMTFVQMLQRRVIILETLVTELSQRVTELENA